MKKTIKLTESQLIHVIKRIISENKEEMLNFSSTDNLSNLKRYVEDNIDFQGYDEYRNTPKSQKIDTLIEIFKDEYGWAVKNMGLKKAFIEWLQGLPSSLDLPFYYDDIKNLLYALGYDQVSNMEDTDISKLYYNELFKIFFGRD
jgi:hypothetical protein